jgi:hypothetical protein
MTGPSTDPPRRRSPIDEILASREPESTLASRYGEGRRNRAEHEDVRESYLALDVRLRSGEYLGLFYYDLAGSPRMDASHTVLTVPFKEVRLVVRGVRLIDLYRAILHHSLDILEETHRPEFAAGEGDGPVIESIEMIQRNQEQ